MDNLILSLGPAFAAGLAVQQFLELTDRFIDQFLKLIGESLGSKIDKKLVMGLISLFLGLVITIGAGLRVLAPLGIQGGELADVFVTALVVSSGTESFNSILKFLGYVKDGRKTNLPAETQEQQSV